MLWGSSYKNGKSNFIFSPPFFFISLCWPLTMFKLYGCSIFRLWNVQCFEMFSFPVMHSSFCFCYIKRITFPRTSFMYNVGHLSTCKPRTGKILLKMYVEAYNFIVYFCFKCLSPWCAFCFTFCFLFVCLLLLFLPGPRLHCFLLLTFMDLVAK